MANSIAVWSDRQDVSSVKQDAVAEIELHFNYWNLLTQQGKSNLSLDIGIKFKNLSSELNVFLPINLPNNDAYLDLGERLKDKQEVVSAIFNENLVIDANNSRTDNYFIVSKSHASNDFFKWITDKPEICKLKNGTHLKFSPNKYTIGINEYGYLRFRIQIDGKNSDFLSTQIEPKDKILLSSEENIELIDFRVNEIRNLPVEICNKIANSVEIQKIHYFIIRNIDVEYLMSDRDYVRCRLLEGDNIWGEYVKGNKNRIDLDKMIIYQWTLQKENQKNQFTNFSKYKHTKKSYLMLLRSIFFIISFAVLANYITTTSLQIPNDFGYLDSLPFFVDGIELLRRGFQALFMLCLLAHLFWIGKFLAYKAKSLVCKIK
ncbi:hypothetical protein [Thorsellia anophelis]|uniref:Uncharacterized protein n=1 Tax=Thorsellia anophelis DSM 18579 TaxID=1123402 RepID=A0A1I0ATH9_9GAMM|nr:hypothetical protein [Thorsellia anophelis]SES97495.1 hypothetical protein SAMN02583745_01050 [Thorsellia anophelis DSM 18579]